MKCVHGTGNNMEYKLKDLDPIEMKEYELFLDTVKVLKMLYGTGVAEKFFTGSMHLYYDVDSESQN